MARERDSFGLALTRLRADLRDGRVRPGAPLATNALAAALRISATPIREALSRLAGEGLVEDYRGRGVFALRYEAADLEALYRLHGTYVDLALELPALSTGPACDDGRDLLTEDGGKRLRRRSEQLWQSVVRAADRGVIARAHLRVSDQLAAPRLVEPMVLDDVDGELEALEALSRATSAAAFSLAVRDYHRRRFASARRLADAIRGMHRSSAL